MVRKRLANEYDGLCRTALASGDHQRAPSSRAPPPQRRTNATQIFRSTATAAALTAAALAPIATPTPANAYCATENWWPGSLIYVNVGDAIPNGWISTLQTASTQWNNVSGANWTIRWTSSSDAHIKFKYSTPSVGFGGAPARAWTKSEGPDGKLITSGDIFFDPTWSWNQNGNLSHANKVADVRTVAVHELGHEIRLDHPSNCLPPFTTTEQDSAMNPNYTKKWTINSDDKTGLAAMK